MKNTSIIFFVLVFSLLFGVDQQKSHAQSSELEIGFVNQQTILNKMPDMKAVQQRLQNYVERKQEEISEREQDFQRQVQEYQQKESVISESAKTREEERLGELRAELQQMSYDLQEEYQERQQELIEPLFEKIQAAINEVAAERGLTFVLNTNTINGDVIVLYASPEAQSNYDITNDVVDRVEM